MSKIIVDLKGDTANKKKQGDEPKTRLKRQLKTFQFYITAFFILLLVLGEVAYILNKVINLSPIADSIATLHIVAYGSMGLGKILTIWFKKDEFRRLIRNLEDLWPINLNDANANETKRAMISRLHLVQISYTFTNIGGLLLYIVTPIFLFVYHYLKDDDAFLGYIWYVWYPFDKTKPVNHAFVFIMEVYTGTTAAIAMLSSDLCFMTLSSHISMLLRLLQVKLRGLSVQNKGITSGDQLDCFDEIVSVIKIHQRLISYGNDLENAFCLINLINVVISSVQICCVAFNILLEPWVVMSNKFYLISTLTQVGIICWFAQEISTASTGIADATYECGWYNCNIRSRKALLILIHRSQKPLHFTAYKFRAITMSTYSSILTTSYSYFALLYTMYRSDTNSNMGQT